MTLPSSGGTDTFEYDLFEASRSGSYLERMFHRRRVAELTRIVELDKQRVLEFGCNTGAILIPLRRNGVDVVGYDISAANVDRLRVHLVAEGLEAKVHAGELPEDAQFDVVLLVNVLEYATDKRVRSWTRSRDTWPPTAGSSSASPTQATPSSASANSARSCRAAATTTSTRLSQPAP